MKVFLSHGTKDRELVQRLAAALDNAAFEPRLCEVSERQSLPPSPGFIFKLAAGPPPTSGPSPPTHL
jgi:hypothetical protein